MAKVPQRYSLSSSSYLRSHELSYAIMISLPEKLAPLSATVALDKILAGEVLRDYRVIGKLDLLAGSSESTYFGHPILLENCWIEELHGSTLSFERPLELLNSYVHKCDLAFAYFLQGLVIEDCVFADYLDFQAGGHNKMGYPVRLLRNTFEGFVNFFDCWYEASVHIEGNKFSGGTNLLGAPKHYQVTFDELPLIQNNIGDLHRNDEAER
ncbi:hypothetical protein [Hymenobacter sp. GOD-10R]|uniref:hypothetical protein n=1 Tax=Hymenobacter sp. GOD-10R TaxID=3093922 RepID=UPI002D78A5AC|nr:hypothetical protein [Hymenobacter sp. GOD-10R]WRQ29376.1 hypothetical protein SD425_03750 [Hymenobacter sp. GOD-10R]